jgi:F-type H+-transporting ATPase subunit c
MPGSKGEIKMSVTAIGAGIAAIACVGAGLGIGNATGSAVDAIARQPEVASKIQSTLILGCALAESTAIYGLVVALLILFTA